MNASNLVLVKTLRHQSEEIAQQGINGWGNTMSDAADAIEAQDMDNDFLDKQLAALRSEIANYETARQEDARRLEQLQSENRFLSGVISGMENAENEKLEQVKGERDAMREALKPFSHPDLCEYLPANKDGGNSPLFQRNKAVITINDCRKAAATLKDAK